MNPEQRDKKLELIRNQVKILSDSFDSVQIFCTKYEPESEGDTSNYQLGIGNWFSRYGQIKAWLIGEDESLKNERSGGSSNG